MNPNLSGQSIKKLHCFVDEEEDYAAEFICLAAFCVQMSAQFSKFQPHNKVEAQKRINKAKNAFSALTDQDKRFLDLQVDMPTMNALEYKSTNACENMLRALDCPVPSSRFSLSRMVLLVFACTAVRNQWVDVSVNNAALTGILEILINDTGLKHDAVDIAGDAVKDPYQRLPEAYANIILGVRWRVTFE